MQGRLTALTNVGIGQPYNSNKILSVSGDSVFQGSAAVSQTLSISGDTVLRGNVSISGDSVLQGRLTALTNVGIGQPYNPNKILSVSGDSVFQGSAAVSQTLSVSGDTVLRGNVSISGDSVLQRNLTVLQNVGIGQPFTTHALSISGDLFINGTIDCSSIIAPNKITRIQYSSSGSSGGVLGFPGYWNLQSGSTDISLNLDIRPTTYIIDGSGSVLDVSLNVVIQSDSFLRTGLSYNFVARNTPPGNTHQIIYPYFLSPTNSTTYTKQIQAPLTSPLVCIGLNDYSST